MTKPTTFMTISIATFATPPRDGQAAPGAHLAGVGLFLATRRASGWRFRSEATVLAAGDSEQDLLQWLADRLPAVDTVIGWQIDNYLIPVLIDAAASADAPIAHHVTARLARALRGTVIDIALDHGGHAALPLEQVAAEMAVAVPAISGNDLLSAWSTGSVDTLRADLAAQALGLWQCFLRHAGLTGLEAQEATVVWIEEQRERRAVQRAGSGA